MSSPHSHRGFTLIELLVVIAVIAILAAVLITGIGGIGKTVKLQTTQSMLSNIVTGARSRAVASNRVVRILIRNTSSAPLYRRQLLILEDGDEGWILTKSTELPDGIYLLPYRTRIPAGFYPAGSESEWRSEDGKNVLGSTALNSSTEVYNYDRGNETWEYIGFTPQGTSQTGAGSLVLVTGRERSGVDVANGSFPLEISNPENVRGVKVSTYGIPRLINDRTGF